MRRFSTIVWGAALVALGSLSSCKRAAESPPPERAPVATVAMVTIAAGEVEERLETLGRVELDAKRTRTVAFATSGQVRQVLVTPGQSVAPGAALLVLGPLPNASPEVRQARIDLEFAEREHERLERMRDGRLATNEQVLEAEKAVSSARAVLEGMGGAERGSADRETRASFPGIVQEVLVTAGSIVHAGEPAVLLAPADGAVVRAGFEPERLRELEVGLAATVEPVLDSDGEGPASGTLAELHRMVDPDTQLVEVVVRTDSAPAWLLLGTVVRVGLVVRSAADAVLVPRSALLARGGTRGVFVVEGGRARWTPIVVGIEGREVVEARSGLAAGAIVVTTGRSVVGDGMEVAVSGPGSSP